MIDQNPISIYGPAVADPTGYGKKFIQDILDTPKQLGPTANIEYHADDTHPFFERTLEGAREHAKDNHQQLVAKGLTVINIVTPFSEDPYPIWHA